MKYLEAAMEVGELAQTIARLDELEKARLHAKDALSAPRPLTIATPGYAEPVNLFGASADVMKVLTDHLNDALEAAVKKLKRDS